MGSPRVRVGRCRAALRHEGWRTVYVARLNTEFLVHVRLPLHAPLCTPWITRILKEIFTPCLFDIKRLSCDRGYVRDRMCHFEPKPTVILLG
jgi:hypothetical protein